MENKINVKDLIDYISSLLNFEISGKLIYLDVVEELESITDLGMFRRELKSRVAHLNNDYKYLNGLQKFTKIVNEYKKKQLELKPKEHDYVVMFCDKLFSKLTDVFEEVRMFRVPTLKQIKNIDLDNTKFKTKNKDKTLYFEEREIKVYKMIGDVVELYRLATQNKVLLQEKIKEAVLKLVEQKKTDALLLANRTQKRLGK